MARLELVGAEPSSREQIVVLDAGPLGIITNPKATSENELSRALVRRWQARGAVVVVPEVADYEVRRELLRLGKSAGLGRLNTLRQTVTFWPITSDTMLRAAELWAQARQQGRPSAPNLALDADMILLAQAEEVARELEAEAVVATTNVRHLAPFANVRQWQDVR